MLKDILVQATGSPEDAVRLSYANAIAARFDAALTCAHLHALPEVLDITDPLRSALVRSLLEESNARASAEFASLQATMNGFTRPATLLQLHGMLADVASELTRLARVADLFIGTRPYGDPAGSYQIEESVLFGSGRACLFLPPGGTPDRDFPTVLVAWDGSREAARALHEAMPFLAAAKRVVVAQVLEPGKTDKAVDLQFAGVSTHLGRHGIVVERNDLPFRASAGEQIHAHAHQLGADLIVMGAYGHARLVQWAFGGATRYILSNATLPVLMAH